MLMKLLLCVASVLVTRTYGQPLIGCVGVNCQHRCEPTFFGYECLCNSGYKRDPNNYHKCVALRANCDPGFENDLYDQSKCLDIDECARNNPCQQGCINGYGTYSCSCRSGYHTDPRDSSKCIADAPICNPGYKPTASGGCADINECETSRPCEQNCYNLPGGYRCSCQPGYEVNENNNDRCNEVQLCTTLADIVLVLDSSGSMGEANNALQLQFASRFVNHFVVGNSKARFGAVLFSDTVERLFNLNDFATTADVSRAILRAPYQQGTTMTNEALDFVGKGMLIDAKGARSNAPDIVVVFTDGQSTKPDLTKISAANLKDKNVRIVAVGIGKEVSKEELRLIASTKNDVFQASSFEGLDYIEQKLARNVCQG